MKEMVHGGDPQSCRSETKQLNAFAFPLEVRSDDDVGGFPSHSQTDSNDWKSTHAKNAET